MINRLGKPARVTESVLYHTVDVVFLDRDKTIQDLETKLAKLKETNNKNPKLEEEIREERKRMRKDITDHILDADVILGTFLTFNTSKKLILI